MQEMQSGIFMQRILKNFQICVLLEESILKRNLTNARNAVWYFHAKEEQCKNCDQFSIEENTNEESMKSEKSYECKICRNLFHVYFI